MQDLEFNVNSKIRVIDENSMTYRFRGIVVQMPDRNPETGEYLDNKCLCELTDPENKIPTQHYWMDFDQICNIQKKFIDIEHLREEDIDLGNGTIRKGNSSAFEIGDEIQITEKIDGANASICFNAEDNKLEVFSRTNLLENPDDLRGFKAYIETKIKPEEFQMLSRYVVFGEWCVSHKVKYDKNWYDTWKVYDIWDKEIRNYCPQNFVKSFCQEHNLEYIHVLYEGEFKSWNHCREFLHKNTYGENQEGIVIKNQSKLNSSYCHGPKYLKIVNDDFKETKKIRVKKEINLEEQRIYAENVKLMKTIVTESRVNKIIMKLVDEGILNSEISPKDMKIICKHLPKMMFEDICKEENEIVKKVGSISGKLCASISLDIARKIVIG